MWYYQIRKWEGSKILVGNAPQSERQLLDLMCIAGVLVETSSDLRLFFLTFLGHYGDV